jgi:hypothetical protein
MSDELKPCPFCGKPILIIASGGPEGSIFDGVMMFHTERDCAMEADGENGPIWNNVDQLIEAINTRPLEDALTAERDALRARIQELLLENERLRVELSQKVL